ncbi:MAG TPA: hypothetical protein VEW08_01165 [Steroidobacteraceae bacterium]|nr:hypothetical protein [Steroidobacteraceae bacterium]
MTDALMPASAEAPSNKQRLFLRYYTGFLMDLVVLNLFAEYSAKVDVDTFTTSLWAALVLQVLLKVTIIFEHKVLDWFKAKTGALMTFLKYFCAWLILFGSKFVILEALAQLFGDKVRFLGIWHGIVTLIVVVVVMLLAEEIMVRVFRRLADKPD